jgi:hypothetical protein
VTGGPVIAGTTSGSPAGPSGQSHSAPGATVRRRQATAGSPSRTEAVRREPGDRGIDGHPLGGGHAGLPFADHEDAAVLLDDHGNDDP